MGSSPLNEGIFGGFVEKYGLGVVGVWSAKAKCAGVDINGCGINKGLGACLGLAPKSPNTSATVGFFTGLEVGVIGVNVYFEDSSFSMASSDGISILAVVLLVITAGGLAVVTACITVVAGARVVAVVTAPGGAPAVAPLVGVPGMMIKKMCIKGRQLN